MRAPHHRDMRDNKGGSSSGSFPCCSLLSSCAIEVRNRKSTTVSSLRSPTKSITKQQKERGRRKAAEQGKLHLACKCVIACGFTRAAREGRANPQLSYCSSQDTKSSMQSGACCPATSLDVVRTGSLWRTWHHRVVFSPTELVLGALPLKLCVASTFCNEKFRREIWAV